MIWPAMLAQFKAEGKAFRGTSRLGLGADFRYKNQIGDGRGTMV
jgi:hypothetical protein